MSRVAPSNFSYIPPSGGFWTNPLRAVDLDDATFAAFLRTISGFGFPADDYFQGSGWNTLGAFLQPMVVRVKHDTAFTTPTTGVGTLTVTVQVSTDSGATFTTKTTHVLTVGQSFSEDVTLALGVVDPTKVVVRVNYHNVYTSGTTRNTSNIYSIEAITDDAAQASMMGFQ